MQPSDFKCVIGLKSEGKKLVSGKRLSSEIELLKKQVYVKAGLKSVGLADIASLTAQIKKETNLDLSQVTMSRLFGLTVSKFGPSLFTLHVLSVYCGCESWDTFLQVNT
ncbi:hypothetical protein [Mucilaginibacter endophyticus]|uniref:hypothetical protein n=1 Tax=Mucilaginibacter endophyticus TaxID=2675003 RepID=UPI000E0CD08A|nr:hypothetical protein [Mucilaginibacter endophyticus]